MNTEWSSVDIAVDRVSMERMAATTYAIKAVARVLQSAVDASTAPDAQIVRRVNGFTVSSLHAALEQLGIPIGRFTVGGLHVALEQLGAHIANDIDRLQTAANRAVKEKQAKGRFAGGGK